MNNFYIYTTATKMWAWHVALVIGVVLWFLMICGLFGFVSPAMLPLSYVAMFFWGIAATCEVAQIVANRVQRMQHRVTA